MCDESSTYRWYWLILPFLLETGKGENEKVLLALFMTTCITKATSIKQAVELFKSVGGFSVESNYDHVGEDSHKVFPLLCLREEIQAISYRGLLD